MERNDAHTVIDVVEEQGGQLKPFVSFSRTPYTWGADIPKPAGPSPTQAPIPDSAHSDYRWAWWGTYDDVPTVIRQKIQKVPLAGRTIYELVRMGCGNGIAYYRNADRTQGNRIQRAYIPEVEGWLRRNRLVDKWLIPQLYDYRYQVNAFSEIIFNKRMDAVTGIYHKGAEHCRISRMNAEQLYPEELYYSPYFGGRDTPQDKEIRAITMYHWWQEEEVLEKVASRMKMAWHSCLETPGRIYYAAPPWLGLFRENGWLDGSAAVPEIVNSMMRKQIRLKYQILIPESYFTIRYRDSWSTMGDEGRAKVIDALVNEIDEKLSGTDEAYVSITTIFNYDAVTKTELGKVQVVAIDDKVKKDEWVPSSEKSDAQIVQGLGGHPSMFGLAPEGGSMGAGSGSDKREVYNLEITGNTIDQAIILEPLNWAAQFNARTNPDWDITFYIDHYRHTTTNAQEDGIERNPDTNLIIE